MNTPGPAVFPPHHSGIAVKPDNAAIPRNYSICGSERLAGEEHLGSFQAPAFLVMGVNVLIPANRILQPFFTRISEGRFNLRAHIRFTDAPVEISHENNRRYLLQKGAVFGLKVWSVRIRRRLMAIFSEIIQNRIQGRVDKYFRKIEEDSLGFGNIRQARIDVNEVALLVLGPFAQSKTSSLQTPHLQAHLSHHQRFAPEPF